MPFVPLLVRALSLSKGEIAREAGITPATLSRIARRGQRASKLTVKRIEAAVLRHLLEAE